MTHTATNFFADIARADASELAAAAILSRRRQLSDVRADRAYQLQDVDFVTPEGDGVEVKTDFTNYAKLRLVVEIWSNIERGTEGFLSQTSARWLAYYFPSRDPACVFVIPVAALREYVAAHLPELRRIQSRTAVGDGYYTSEAVLVDPDELPCLQVVYDHVH